MKWEQVRGGWDGEKRREIRVEKRSCFYRFLINFNCRHHEQQHLRHLKILNPITVVMDNGI